MVVLNRRVDIGKIAREADRFREHLGTVKARISAKNKDVQWYPYGSLGGFSTLEKLLTGERRFLLELAGDVPVLDLGCADGEIAFFLESLGCRVRAIDYPATNYNGMRGIRALKAELNSAVEIYAMDIDSQFTLPERYGLAFFLGTLYHLKNPYYALDTLARRARYCVLSTKVASFTPGKGARIHDLPVAYLLGESESNEDATNYWVFSQAGLRRIVERAGWEVLDYLAVGNTTDSDPVSWEGDERAFCLLTSRVADYARSVDLLQGWHELEYESWRWTERVFSVALREPAKRPSLTLKLGFFLPDALMERCGSIELGAAVNGEALPPEVYTKPGEYIYVRSFPARPAVVIEFEVDHALAPDEDDPRERAMIVSSIQVE